MLGGFLVKAKYRRALKNFISVFPREEHGFDQKKAKKMKFSLVYALIHTYRLVSRVRGA